MMTMENYLGTDLVVIPYHAAQDAGQYDLATRVRVLRDPPPGEGVFPVQGGKQSQGEVTDLATFSGRENLAQALILRLLTPRGSLAQLGHASYGSRLGELIGQPKTQALRNLCRAFVLEAVAQEARVEPKAVSFSFDLQAETLSSIVFILAVQPVQGGEPLSLSLEVAL